MYRPNFCAECGERVERERWRWWTSGRFCTACDVRFRRRRLLLPTVLCATLLSVGFVAGRGLRRAHAPQPPPLVVTRAVETQSPRTGAEPPAQASGARLPDGAGGRASEPSTNRDLTERDLTDPNETVSMCGARTKKGTPCSRRVRGVGRCWQHRGRAAMLPPSKLIVPG